MNGDWVLPLRKVPQSGATKDLSIVWNTVHLAYEQTLFGQVTSATYNHGGSLLGCTSTNQFALLRVPQTDGVVVNEQSERKTFSVSFRDDDKLYVETMDQRVVVKSTETAFERQFLGHTRDVRSAIFLGKHNFVSASDDTTIKLWDLLSDDDLGTARVHTDYVRSLANYSSGSFLSGSYDHVVNLWDPRTGLEKPLQSSAAALSHAVEAITYIAEKELVAVASGDHVTLFDPRRSLTAALFQGSFHTKSVVSLAYSQQHETLLTASLDCRVKMFTFQGEELSCLSSKHFENPITAVAVHPLSKEYAVGSATGELQVFKFKEPETLQAEGADEAEAEMNMLPGSKQATRTKEEVLRDKMKEVQFQLRSFQYSKALKTALYSRHPDVLVSTFEEMLRRGALHLALNNQNDRTIVRVLRFATEYVDRPQFTDTMLAVFDTILDIYSVAASRSKYFHRELTIAHKRIGAYLAAMQRMERVMGIMDMIVNASPEL